MRKQIKTPVENCARSSKFICIFCLSKCQLSCRGGGGVNKIQSYLICNQVHFINAEFRIKNLVGLHAMKVLFIGKAMEGETG